jgi:putative oxidoreductase
MSRASSPTIWYTGSTKRGCLVDSVRLVRKCHTLPRVTAQNEDYGRHQLFTDSGSRDVVEPPRDLSFDDDDPRTLTRWHGGLDFGLLIMRLAVGGTLGLHGLQKVFGLFNGPGLDEFAHQLGAQGFTSQTTLLSWLGGIAEVAGGGLLILGLFTPAAAAALLSLTATAVYLKYRSGIVLGTGDGFEYHVLLAATAFGLLFTGPGRISVDLNTPWRRKPVPYAFVGVVLAAGAVAAIMTVFRR